MKAMVLVVLLVSAVLGGCIADDKPAAVSDTEPAPDEIPGPFAVIAFIDAGINPYHVDFRDDSPRAFQHPSTYLPDYPPDAVTLNLSFQYETLEEAVDADCEAWEAVEENTLYWVPGTRIVGMTIQGMLGLEGHWGEGFSCDDEAPEWPPFIENGWHGTMVASRGAGAEHGACQSCLIAALWGWDTGSVQWAAKQPWIDVQSNSWAWNALGNPGPEDVAIIEDAASNQPAFWASMNGLGGQFGVLGEPTQAHMHFTPSTIRVGAHDAGHVTVWHGSSPHIVSDGCWSWAAEHLTMEERSPRTGGGTSGATPYAAGIAAELILEARAIMDHDTTGVHDRVIAKGSSGTVEAGPLIDGEFTMDELERLLFTTADARPERTNEDGDICLTTEAVEAATDQPLTLLYTALPVEWRDIPNGPAGIPLIGYGAVTPTTAEHAFEVLRGKASMPDRPDEDAFFEVDNTYRETVYDVYSAL